MRTRTPSLVAGSAHGDDGVGEGRTGPPRGHEDRAAARQRSPRCCASAAGCTSSAARSWWRPSSTPALPPVACAATSPRSTATRATSPSSRPAGCAGAAATWSGWSPPARRSHARPACSTAAAARCVGCPRRSCPAQPATRRQRGAAPSSRTGRSPSRADPRRSRSPARARRPHSRWSAPRGALGIQAKAREVRGVDRVVVRDGDAIGALLTRLGAHDSVLAWEERRMRREVRATANRLANFDDANLRRSARAAVAAGARVERALEILADDVPEHLRGRGTASPRAQAGEPGGARPAVRPADDQGRRRRPDPAPAGDGRQQGRRERHPRHGGKPDRRTCSAAVTGIPPTSDIEPAPAAPRREGVAVS